MAEQVQIAPGAINIEIPLATNPEIFKTKVTTQVKNFFYVPCRKFPPMIVACIFFISVTYIMAIVQVSIQNFSVKRGIDRNLPIYDVGFEVLPYSNHEHLPDLVVTGLMISVISIIFLNRGLQIFIDLVRRFLTVMGCVYAIRTISISITLLPNPFPQCKASQMGNPAVDALLILIGQTKTCQDCFFSGHSVAICLSVLVWYDYLKARLWIRMLSIPAALIGGFVIISSHFHYSVDVMFGFLISFFVWKYFHSFIHRISRYLVRRKEDLHHQQKHFTPKSWWSLTKHFLKTEVGRVDTNEIKPMENKPMLDSQHVFMTMIVLRFIVWYESWECLLVMESDERVYEQV
jgi:hypothetical protein